MAGLPSRPEWPAWQPPSQCLTGSSEAMARHTWRICLCNRKDTWCNHWPLGTRCNPPSPTAAVLPAWTWWSAIRGNGSTPGGAACNFSGQGFPDGRPGRVPAQACPQLGDSSQATCLARSVITVTQVRHGGGLVFFLPGHSGYDDVDYVAAGWHLIGVLPRSQLSWLSLLSSSPPSGVANPFRPALASSSPISSSSIETPATADLSSMSSV